MKVAVGGGLQFNLQRKKGLNCVKLCEEGVTECQVEVYTADYNCDSIGGGRSWWLRFTVNSS